MSQTEIHKGRLVEFPRENLEQDKEYLKRFLKEEFKEETWEDSIQEYIYENDLYEKVIYWRDILYSNEDHRELDEDENLFLKTEKGIEYFVSFYNGGTCLSEMLEEGIDEVNKQK